MIKIMKSKKWVWRSNDQTIQSYIFWKSQRLNMWLDMSVCVCFGLLAWLKECQNPWTTLRSWIMMIGLGHNNMNWWLAQHKSTPKKKTWTNNGISPPWHHNHILCYTFCHTQLIPNVVWRSVYFDYQIKYPNLISPMWHLEKIEYMKFQWRGEWKGNVSMWWNVIMSKSHKLACFKKCLE